MTTIERLTASFMVAAAMAVASGTAHAGDTGRRVGGTVEESAKTGAHAVRDGALTAGRTVRDFFKGGADAAGETWRENADRTKENARAGGQRVENEAEQ